MIDLYSAKIYNELTDIVDNINNEKEKILEETKQLNEQSKQLSDAVEKYGNDISSIMYEICGKLNTDFLVDLKNEITSLLKSFIEKIIKDFFNIIPFDKLKEMITELVKIYDVYYLALLKYKHLINEITKLTNISDIKKQLNNLKTFISDKINSMKSMIDSVLNGCIITIGKLIKDLNSQMRSFNIDEISININTNYLDENETISALLSNETIHNWITDITDSTDYVNITFSGVCDPINATTTIEITITDSDNTTYNSIFEVEHGDFDFDSEITPTLIHNHEIDKYNGLFKTGNFTVSNDGTSVTIDDLDTSTNNELVTIKDVLVASQIIEERSTAPTNEQEQYDDLISLTRTNSITTSRTAPTPSAESSENIDIRLDDIGQLIKLSDYNVYYNQDGTRKEYEGWGILENLITEQNVNVSINELFDYYNETHRLGLTPIEPPTDKVKPKATSTKICKSSHLQNCNLLKSFILVNRNVTVDYSDFKEDVEFPIDKYNSVITPYRESSGDLMIDLLVDIDNYLSDETVSEEQYEQAKQIKEEILQMTKYNIERLTEFKSEFGDIVTSVSVRDFTTYIRPSVNPVCYDYTLCMYGSFINKENVIAFVLLTDLIIEVQYWKFVNDEIGYKYSRLDKIQISSFFDLIIYSWDVIENNLVFTITTNESDKPIIFKEYNVPFGKNTTTSDKYDIIICSDVPIGDKLRQIGRLLAMNDNLIKYPIDMYDLSVEITNSNKNYFREITDVFRNNLLLGTDAFIVQKMPINKCSFKLITLSWFVAPEYDPDDSTVFICELYSGLEISFDITSYEHHWICFSIDFVKNEIYVNGSLFKTLDETDPIKYLFQEGQHIACISFNKFDESSLAESFIDTLENP